MRYVLVQVAGRSYDYTDQGQPMKVWTERERERFLRSLPSSLSAVFVDLSTGNTVTMRGKKCEAACTNFLG